jgi:carbon-monoxide dehydrogenase small subunit
MSEVADEVDVTLHVNGEMYAVRIESRYLLSDVLRDKMRLTGLHLGCEQGVCGACTVMIDGEPAVSCLTLAVDVEGRSIETVEHLSKPNGALGDLEHSFVEHGAFQCGFCTPGFLVMGHHLINQGLAGDRDTVRAHLSGNICRCTGYESIVDAIVAVGTKGRPA